MESEYPEDLDTVDTSRSSRNPEEFVVIDGAIDNKKHVIPWTEFTVKFHPGIEDFN